MLTLRDLALCRDRRGWHRGSRRLWFGLRREALYRPALGLSVFGSECLDQRPGLFIERGRQHDQIALLSDAQAVCDSVVFVEYSVDRIRAEPGADRALGQQCNHFTRIAASPVGAFPEDD